MTGGLIKFLALSKALLALPAPRHAGSGDQPSASAPPSSIARTGLGTRLARRIRHTSRALVALHGQGRALIERIPAPVQLQLRNVSRGSAKVGREVFAGLLVIAIVAVGIGYGRLSKGPISLGFLVPMIETAINSQLGDLEVQLDDAVLQREQDSAEVAFRLTNVRLLEKDGSVVAQSPLAAIGLSGSALLTGLIAPGSVDFIGPRLLLLYDPEKGLGLSFAKPGAQIEKPDFAPEPAPVQTKKIPTEPPSLTETVVAKTASPKRPAGPVRRLDVTRTLAETMARLRDGGGTSSYLTRFGVKDAVVVFDQRGIRTSWSVPDFSIDLKHKRRASVILGTASVASSAGPWRIEFRTEQSEKRERLELKGVIRDLVPMAIANIPGLEALKALDTPVTVETSLELTSSGELVAAEARLRLAAGHITLPRQVEHPMLIDEGDLRIRYLKEENRIEILPSTLNWGVSEVTISGGISPSAASTDQKKLWDFALFGDGASLAVEDFRLSAVKVDQLRADGTLDPDAGRMSINRLILKSGDASLQLAGDITNAPNSPDMRLEGSISPMPLDMLKRFWPKFLSPGSREWIGHNVRAGDVAGGTFKIALGGGELDGIHHGGDLTPDAVVLDLDVRDLGIDYIGGLPPLVIPEAHLSNRGRVFTIDAPRGAVSLPSGQRLDFRDGRFFVADHRPDHPDSELSFRAAGQTAAVLELLDHEPLGYVRAVGLTPDQVGGGADGGFRVMIPLTPKLRFADVKLRGMARLDNLTAPPGMLGALGIEGGALDLNVSEQAIEARGDVTLKGVPAQIHWQRIFDVPKDRQPNIRVSAVLDDAARGKLGLDTNDLVRGETPISLLLGENAEGKRTIQAQADLTNARLTVAAMGWTKPAGQAATLRFDVASKPDGGTNLDNLEIVGNGISVDGWLSLDHQNKLKAFHFSDFSSNPQTHLELSGAVRGDGILAVKANGSSYDGRELLQSLVSTTQPAAGKAETGVDFDATIGSVTGNYDTTLRDTKITLRKRRGELIALDARGMLNGRNTFAVKLDGGDGRDRVIRAESGDAGAAFRLIGVYPQIEGGQASVEVNLDAGASNNDKSGTLWARNFTVVGDAVVGQVLTDANKTPQAQGQARQKRKVPNTAASGQRLQFDQLRAPFSVVGSRVALHDAYINGPILGATVRGDINFASRRIDLNGTYVPLYGLNSLVGFVPIIGNLLVGREGEGVVGITFAVQGSMSNPDVRVNPISMVAPGIFRQMFEYTGSNAPRSQANSAASTEGGFPKF